MARQGSEEDDHALADVVALGLVVGASLRRLLVKVLFVNREQRLDLLGAVQLDHGTPRGHRRVTHELIVVTKHLGQERADQR